MADPSPLSSDQTAALKEIQGVLERITFQNQENGFTVARLKEPGKTGEDLTTVVGSLSGVPVGSTLSLSGWWVRDAKHGWQFKINSFAVIKPNTVNGMERYLGSGLIKGIGPKYAGRIVKEFGLDTLDVLDQTPDRLHAVPGLGAKRVEQIKTAWAEQKEIHRIMVFLQGHGISATFAVKIYKTYGGQSLAVINENPYRLAEDIWGIGFRSADRIAQALGLPANDPRRARAGLLFALNEAISEGHCFLPTAFLLKEAEELLELSPLLLEEQIPELLALEKIIRDNDDIYLAPLFFAEKGAGHNLATLSRVGSSFTTINAEVAIPWACERLKLLLAPEQTQALKSALLHNVTVLTGGPGTGKSTILKALLLILEAKGCNVKLAAPTGRAAKRLLETTGREAKTIHRLLEFEPSSRGFKKNADNQLKADFVIIDEASMLDIVLANSLFKAIPRSASLLLVGDVDQLPSVGPGNVLRDVIDSGLAPVTRLTRIFRQGEGSLISLNAARINRGESLELLPDFKGHKDFYCIFRDDPEEIAREIVSLCRSRLPKRYGFDPIRDIQVLTPMRRGLIGADALNALLQESLNASGLALEVRNRAYRTGDKVMQIRNNYDKEVFNGDLGLVCDRDLEDQTVTVDFDGRQVVYELSELNELVLAYAVTVHKSQGSEFACVLLPIHTSHYPLLQRNLFYTGITRGKRMVVVVGSRKAISIAIRTHRENKRNTRLGERLLS